MSSIRAGNKNRTSARGVTFATTATQEEDVVYEDDNDPANASGAPDPSLHTDQEVEMAETMQAPVVCNALQCPNCGGRAIEQHEASGASVCTECGVVVEENAIVSSVEFVEGAGGASSMVGQFVSASSSKAYSSGGRYGFSRDSRETTLANGRRTIQELASRLRLGPPYVDGAHRLFTVAVEKNFVQGRRTTHVVAACLYMTCRQEKSQHMLIDFSDALQVNVYALGTCFLKFRRLLGLKLEIIDPALYVYRFAAHLDLDDRANRVSLTALRLVARMKRDWMVAGRRPAGICAAALLIAARAHGFDKQATDVTRILRICGRTVTTRLQEFEQTPSARLSLQQFQTVDLAGEQDPPIYTRHRLLEARVRAIRQGDIVLLESGALDDEGKHGSRWRDSLTKAPSERSLMFDELYQSLQKTLDSTSDGPSSDIVLDLSQTEADTIAAAAVAAASTPQVSRITLRADAANTKDKSTTPSTSKKNAIDESNAVVVAENLSPNWKKAFPQARGRDMILPHEATVEEQKPSTVPTEVKISLKEWKQDLPASIDEEVNDFFRSPEEEKLKMAIFNKINKDYIATQDRKEAERVSAIEKASTQETDDMIQAAEQARYKNKKRGASSANLATTEEQLRAAVANRRVSRKINYDALSSIFDDDGSFATDTVVDETPHEEDENHDMLFAGV